MPLESPMSTHPTTAHPPEGLVGADRRHPVRRRVEVRHGGRGVEAWRRQARRAGAAAGLARGRL